MVDGNVHRGEHRSNCPVIVRCIRSTSVRSSSTVSGSTHTELALVSHVKTMVIGARLVLIREGRSTYVPPYVCSILLKLALLLANRLVSRNQPVRIFVATLYE